MFQWHHVKMSKDLEGSDFGPEIHQTLLGPVLSMHLLIL